MESLLWRPGQNILLEIHGDVGDVSSIVHLWGYDSYAERERRRALLQADQRWKDFLPRLQPLIHTQRTRILLPTSYSPVR